MGHVNLLRKIIGNLSLSAYVLWLLAILMLAWGTMPYMISPSPPGWLTSFARLVFYRDYIF